MKNNESARTHRLRPSQANHGSLAYHSITPFQPDDVLESLVMLACAALDGYIREQRLRQEIAKLRVKIDETRHAHQVAEITETEYFQFLQAKAGEMHLRLHCKKAMKHKVHKRFLRT